MFDDEEESILNELVPMDYWVLIGGGQYGNVYKTVFKYNSEDNNTTYAAVKVINVEPKKYQDIRAEYRAAKEMLQRHRSLPKVYGCELTRNKFYIVMEYFECGNLRNIFESYPNYTEVVVKSIVMQLVDGLVYLKTKNLVHRDIKLENVLVKRWNPITVALADFNFSKLLIFNSRTTQLRTALGTTGYKAPEVYTQKLQDEHSLVYARANPNKPYDFKCDVWSLGCVMYLLLSGGWLPHRLDLIQLKEQEKLDGKNKYKYWNKVIREKTCGMNAVVRFDPAPQWYRVSQEAKELLKGVAEEERDFLPGMLVKDPEYRCNYQNILESDWLSSYAEDLTSDKHWPVLYDPDNLTNLPFEEQETFMFGSAGNI